MSDDNFDLIHDEFHRCIETIKYLRNYNKKLKSVIKTILDKNEHICLDSEKDKEELLETLTKELNLDKIDTILEEPSIPKNLEWKHIDLFDTSILFED
tara:strand:+ start:686 stop:979 length:294 start_codon:yes stop_codon:yes gene_type:complete